jgi:hypothetical protein
VSKEKLNLVEFTAGLMAEPRASSPEIMRRKFVDAGFSRILPDDVPNDFLAHSASPYSTCLRLAPKDLPVRDTGQAQPIVHQILHPIRHRNGPNM